MIGNNTAMRQRKERIEALRGVLIKNKQIELSILRKAMFANLDISPLLLERYLGELEQLGEISRKGEIIKYIE
jgi:hypothetical protein